MVCFCLTDCFQGLSLVGTHSDLSYVNITVSSSNQTKVFLANTLTGSSKLGDGAERSCFRSLATGVGVNLRIKYEDVDIFAGCDDVVETSVTDIVRSTVTTDNPLAALDEVILELGNGLAEFTFILGSFYHRNNLGSSSLALVGIILTVEPLLEGLFVFSRSAFSSNSSLHGFYQTAAELLVGKFHTQTEFAEVLEQRVCPCRTLTLLVGCIRGRRNRTGVDGRTSCCVGNHFAVTEELGNQLHVRSLTTAGAST